MANAPERVQQGPQPASSRPWLPALKEYIAQNSSDAAAEYWPPLRPDQPPYYNFRLEHIRQVERDALRIHSIERGDKDVILAAVWAHDRFQPQFSGENHAARAAEWARDYLKFIRFPDNKIHDVCRAILYHSRHDMDIPEECHEARVLWDADHVARCGPADIINFILCYTAEDFLKDLPEDCRFPEGAMTVRDVVMLLIEHRPQLFHADWFYFDETRRMARERISASRSFLDSLETQVFPRHRPVAR
jgi:predicted metal-dependent HD superfamily phosphohydrolase